jgi:TatD DNase family protein
MNHGSETGRVPEDTVDFVDTHCHLDDRSFAADIDEVLERARDAGVTRWINVGFNPERWTTSIDLARRFPGMFSMLGVHPADAGLWNDSVARSLAMAVEQHHSVAIGEIGLDFFRGETNVDEQLAAFHAQLDLAISVKIPAVVHMRSAEPLMIDTLRNRQNLPTLLFHSYDGSEALTTWIIATSSYVGVGGLATRTKSSVLRREVKRIPLEQIVLETDSPYLAPNGFDHRRNTPESIPHIASFLAGLQGVDIATVARQTTLNADRVFSGMTPA